MVSDDRIEQSEQDRERILEEIRRRAEEAELRRIEEEEQTLEVPPVVTPPPERPSPTIQHPPVSEEPPLPPRSGSLPPKPTPTKKKLTEMFKRAEAAYQQEQYDDALRGAEEILSLHPENEQALQLLEDIKRSQALSELIKKEEALRREQGEPAPEPILPVSAPPPQQEEKFWGQTEIKSADADGLEVDESAPEPPRKLPLVERIAQRLASIRIPVKPILFGAGALLALAAGYYIVHRLVTAVVPPHNTLLIARPAVPAGDERSRRFADGIAEELGRQIGRVDDMWVIGAFSALQSEAENAPPKNLSSSFGVRFVLSSSLQMLGDSLRWQASLFDSLKAATVWSTQLSSRQGEINLHLSGVVQQLLTTVGIDAGTVQAIRFPRAQNVADSALDAYFAGRALLRAGDFASLLTAEQCFLQALRVDSMFAEAHSALAWTILAKAEWDSIATNRVFATAFEHTQRASRSGGRSPEDYRTLAMTELYGANTEKALELMQESAKRCPSDAETQRRLAQILLARGKTEEAVQAAEAAVALDPRNPVSHFVVGVVRQMREEYAEALPHVQVLFNAGAARTTLGSTLYPDLLIYLHRPEDALAAAAERVGHAQGDPDAHYHWARIGQIAGHPKEEWATPLLRAESLLADSMTATESSPSAQAMLALIYTRLGEFKAAREASKHALELGPKNVDVLYMTARMYALQRDKAEAMAYLQRAKKARYRLDYLVDLDLFNLRSEPGFLGLGIQ